MQHAKQFYTNQLNYSISNLWKLRNFDDKVESFEKYFELSVPFSDIETLTYPCQPHFWDQPAKWFSEIVISSFDCTE